MVKPGNECHHGSLHPGPSDIAREADRFQHADEVPSDVDLPPMPAQTRRANRGMVIPVPVFAPGSQLERPQPPHILAGVSFIRVLQVREAVYKTLHMQRIDQANGADPKESLPAERQAAQQREQKHRHFRKSPCLVCRPVQFRTPPLRVGWGALIEPAQVSPPEAPMLGAGNVLRRIGSIMMMTVVGHPTCWMPGAIKHGPENQKLFNGLVDLKSAVREQAMVSNRRAQSTEACQ